MSLKLRIKNLEQDKRGAIIQRGAHVIFFRPKIDNAGAMIDEYRKQGGKLFVFAMPYFNFSLATRQEAGSSVASTGPSELARPKPTQP